MLEEMLRSQTPPRPPRPVRSAPPSHRSSLLPWSSLSWRDEALGAKEGARDRTGKRSVQSRHDSDSSRPAGLSVDAPPVQIMRLHGHVSQPNTPARSGHSASSETRTRHPTLSIIRKKPDMQSLGQTGASEATVQGIQVISYSSGDTVQKIQFRRYNSEDTVQEIQFRRYSSEDTD